MSTQPELFEAPRSGEALASVAADEKTGKPIPEASADNTGSSAVLPRSKAARIVELAQQALLTDAERGELDLLLDRAVPVDSPRLTDWLYGKWGFPERYVKEGTRNTTRLSRSLDAILATFRASKKDERLALVLRLLRLRSERAALNVKLDKQ